MVRTIKERAKKVLELTQKCAQGAPEVRSFHITAAQIKSDVLIFRFSMEMALNVPVNPKRTRPS